MYRPEQIINVEKLKIELLAKDEVFKTVRIYDNYYNKFLISNYGRVYSFNVDRFMAISIDTNGYYRVKLGANGKRITISIHRLVAFAFVENPDKDNLNVVNHKGENPLNNKWTNLEWCDDKYNLNYGTAQKRRAAQRAKKVFQYDLNNNFIAEYESLPDVFKKTGFHASAICKYCNNGEIYNGYFWRYAS